MAKILVIDDDSVLTDTVDLWLTFQKHEVTVANTGFAGWDLLQKNQFELVVLDWDLPDVNGIDILKRFRETGGATPIIMLTGHSSINDKAAGFDSGANDYMTKPFEMEELSIRIKAILRSQAAVAAPPAPLGQGNEEVLKKADLAGTRLAASYEFLDVIAEGAYGIVFKARHPRLDKLVAIKMLLSSKLNEVAIARFEREARAITQIDHYNVITVHDYGVTERNRPYMVMDYVQGESLLEKIDREGALPLATALAILIQVCTGLEEAHSKGIIHRDLKLENIILQQSRSDRADWVKIVDFGLAHLIAGTHERLTKARGLVGTVGYIAPERLRDETCDARSDIYSLGVILFEILTCRPFIEADTEEALLIKVLTTSPNPPSHYRQDISPGSAIDKTFLKATEKDPDKRHQSAAEMRRELRQIYSQLAHIRPGNKM